MTPREIQLERERLAAQTAKDAAAQRTASGVSVTDQRVRMADADFSRWQGAAESQRKWIETLAEYRMKAAQADLTEAQAEYQRAQTADKMQTVRAKMAVVARLERELQWLRQSEYAHRQAMKRLEANARAASAVRNIPHLSPESVAALWVAWRFFLARCPLQTAKDLHESGAIAFVERVQISRQLPEAGSAEHRQLIEAFGAVAASADTIRADAESKLSALRAGTYDVWKPSSLLSAEG